jgi:hypothetical protein
MCVQCGQGIEVLLPTNRDAIALLLAQRGWFVSILSPPKQVPEKPILFGALCTSCAPSVFPPEVLKAAEEHRQKMLQGVR